MKKDSAQKDTSVVLFDVFSMLFRAYHALPPLSTPDGRPIGAIYGLASSVFKVLKDMKPAYVVACFDREGKTHRHEVFEEYKGTREEPEDDLIAQIDLCYQFFDALGVKTLGYPGYEADDIIGTLSKVCAKKGPVYIVTSDNDMLQLVNDNTRVILFSRGAQAVVYDEAAVREKFGFGPEAVTDYKGLRGDPSDNIPGVRGIGDVSAKKMLSQYSSLEAVYKAVDAGDEVVSKRVTTLLQEGRDVAFLSKGLATIVCDVEIKEPIDEWKPSAESIVTFLEELAMKGLAGKAREQFGGKATTNSADVVQDSAAADTLSPKDAALLHETQIAAWVLDSNKTSITQQEILEDTGAATLAAANKHILAELKKEGTLSVFTDIEKPLILIIEKMQERGICVSKKQLQKHDKALTKRKNDLVKEMHDLAGVEFNPSSPKQVAEVLQKVGVVLRKKTAGGATSTNESQLLLVKDQHAIVPLLLRHRHISKLQTGYTNALLERLQEDGKIHTTFLQNGTTTGRMASRDPNMQNIPKYSEEGVMIRDVFIPSDGFTLVSLDYSQMEIRIAALLSGDENFSSIVSDEKDIHAETARRLFNATEVTEKEREQAKRVNFGILYGMGPHALARDLETSFEEAQYLLAQYWQSFPLLYKYLESVKTQVREKGFVATHFKRRRHFPLAGVSNAQARAAIERAAINAPVQGTGADMVKIAMIKTSQVISDPSYKDAAYLLLQVHDELVFEVKDELVAELASKLKATMEKEVLNDSRVAFPVAVSAGKTLGSEKPL